MVINKHFIYKCVFNLIQTDKNQLKRLVDDVSAGNYPDDIDSQAEVVNYEYDANGNLVYDRSEEINSIAWTNAGKIQGNLHSLHLV